MLLLQSLLCGHRLLNASSPVKVKKRIAFSNINIKNRNTLNNININTLMVWSAQTTNKLQVTNTNRFTVKLN